MEKVRMVRGVFDGFERLTFSFLMRADHRKMMLVRKDLAGSEIVLTGQGMCDEVSFYQPSDGLSVIQFKHKYGHSVSFTTNAKYKEFIEVLRSRGCIAEDKVVEMISDEENEDGEDYDA